MTTGKILIIGLDGATWKLLDQMMDRGLMPNLRRLADEGAKGALESSIPPVTAPAWSTFHTGVNPGKHGIYDFQEYDRTTHETKLINGDSIRVKTMWDHLNEAGKKTITINVPGSYPPRNVEGRITVGCFLTPRMDESMVRPRELFKDMTDIGYRIVPGPLQDRYDTPLKDFIDNQIATEVARFGLARKWLREKPWDVFMVHNQTIDGIQHAFYPFMDKDSPNFDKVKSAEIERFYAGSDRLIGELLSEIPEGTLVMLISDHGFMEVRRKFNLSTWLRKEGYLRLNSMSLLSTLMSIVSRLDVFNLRKRLLGSLMRKKTFIITQMASAMTLNVIDWDRSTAYMGNGNVYGNIYLHDCPPDRRAALVSEIRGKLMALKDPATGAKIVREIFDVREIYDGPYTDTFPDLFVELVRDYICAMPIVAESEMFATPDLKYDYIGSHDRDGIFLAWGPGVRKGKGMRFRIMDIAPTVLAMMNGRVPSYMDGSPAGAAFENKIQYEMVDVSSSRSGEGPSEAGRSDDNEVKDRLRDLGYL